MRSWKAHVLVFGGLTIAEVSNMIGNRVKKPRLEGRSYVVPDSVITGARDSSAMESSLASEQMVRQHTIFSFYSLVNVKTD